MPEKIPKFRKNPKIPKKYLNLKKIPLSQKSDRHVLDMNTRKPFRQKEDHFRVLFYKSRHDWKSKTNSERQEYNQSDKSVKQTKICQHKIFPGGLKINDLQKLFTKNYKILGDPKRTSDVWRCFWAGRIVERTQLTFIR